MTVMCVLYASKRKSLVKQNIICMYDIIGGASPAVLPSLQLMYPNKFHANSMIPQIDLHEVLPLHHTENKQTLGELMLGFLQYYSNHFE